MEFSIIIPIYNSEKYLQECLESICKQIHKKKVEIILINDCSLDKSINICKNYIRKFRFIRLINQEKNRGVSYCRNIGIKNASGKYICFVDSDDKLAVGSINLIIKNIRNFSKNEIFVLRSREISRKLVDKNQFLQSSLQKKNISILNHINDFDLFRATCWNFIVKKNFLKSNNIYFKNIKTYEDQVFVSEIICLSKNFKVIQKTIYFCRIYEPNTLGKISGYVVVKSCAKIIYELANFIEQKKKLLNNKKIKFLVSRLNFVLKQFLLNLTICSTYEVKNIAKFLNKKKSIILRLSRCHFNRLNFLFNKKINIDEILINYKLKKIIFLSNIIKEFKNDNIILFCAGGYGEIVLKSYNKLGVKINFIVDNNPNYNNKKLDNTIIKKPSYLKNNLCKFSNHKILVCNEKINEFSKITLQLSKIGIEKNNIFHVEM